MDVKNFNNREEYEEFSEKSYKNFLTEIEAIRKVTVFE